MSRALGDHFLKHEKLGVTGVPQVYPPIKLEPTDTMLIVASDGVSHLGVLGNFPNFFLDLGRFDWRSSSRYL